MKRIDFRMVIIQSGYSWFVGTAVLVLGLAVWSYATDPPNRPYTLLTPLFFAFAAYVVVRSKQWIEATDDDVTLVQRRAFKTVRVGLKDARRIYVRTNHGGTAQIVAEGDGGKAFAQIYLHSMYSKCYLRADGLAALAEGVMLNRVPDSLAPQTGELLLRQLAHIRADGPFEGAPLAAFATDATGPIATTGGAGSAGNVSDLL